MRPIKFKAKTSDGEWVEGSYLNLFNEKKGEYTHEIGYQLFEGASMDYPYPTCDTHFREIDPSTLCQFTGLTDKNGVEIYEGDIFRYSGLLYVVEWIRYGFRFKLMDESNQHKHWYLDDINIQNECEVIGNIHNKTD